MVALGTQRTLRPESAADLRGPTAEPPTQSEDNAGRLGSIHTDGLDGVGAQPDADGGRGH